MNRSIWGIALAVLAAVSSAAAEPVGFGDLKWGDPLPKGWKLTTSCESQVHPEKARGASFGNARLERVEYEFSQGRFVGAALFVKERSGYLALKKELESQYKAPGLEVPIYPAAESCHWEGEETGADLYYVGEGISPVLFLSWIPASGVPGGPVETLAERRLQDRLRLCAQVAEVLDKSIKAGEERSSDLDGDLNAVSGRLPGGCGGKGDFSADRETLQQEKRAAQTSSQTAVTERARLQKESDRLTAELEALRARRATVAPAP